MDGILIGCHRAGRYIYTSLCQLFRILVIEHDLSRLRDLKDMGICCLYGDASDSETWESLGDLPDLKFVASTIPDIEQSLAILCYLKGKRPDLVVILSADHINEASRLYEAGADYVFCPYVIAGQRMEDGWLADLLNPSVMSTERAKAQRHIDEMSAKWKLGLCPLCREPAPETKTDLTAGKE